MTSILSVKEYLEQKGYRWQQRGDKWVTNSPYKREKGEADSNPSFYLYPSGKFKCYATGNCGYVEKLARDLFNGERPVVGGWLAKPSPPKKPLPGCIPSQYLNLTPHECERVEAYASGRKITRGYEKGVWVMQGKRWPSLIFPHTEDGVIVWAKLRLIDGQKGDRMRTIGRIGFYVLDARIGGMPPVMYLIESETSANSLWEYLMQQKISAIVLSCGSVGTVPKSLPFDYPLRKIIDFDGSEDLWKTRIAKYTHLGGENIKLPLPKGEDINSLFVKDQMYRINFLL